MVYGDFTVNNIMKTLLLILCLTATSAMAQEINLECKSASTIEYIMIDPDKRIAAANSGQRSLVARLLTDGVKYQFKIISNTDINLSGVYTINRADLTYSKMTVNSIEKGQCVKVQSKNAI